MAKKGMKRPGGTGPEDKSQAPGSAAPQNSAGGGGQGRSKPGQNS